MNGWYRQHLDQKALRVLGHVRGVVDLSVSEYAEIFLVPGVLAFFVLFSECFNEVCDHADVQDGDRKFDVSPVSGAPVSVSGAESAESVADAAEPRISESAFDGFTVVQASWFGDFEDGGFFDVGPDGEFHGPRWVRDGSVYEVSPYKVSYS